MSPDPDDDALRWEGDDDPTLAPGWKVVGKSAPLDAATDGTDAAASDLDADADVDVPARDTAGTGDTADTADTAEADSAHQEPTPRDADATRQAGSAELVILGVLGGIYLLYSLGWLIWATTPAPQLADPVAQFMYGLGRWLAVLAPALWFGTTLWLASERRRARLLWLIVGAIVLVPVPFLLRG